MFAGCIPAHAAYFSLFETMKKALGADREGHYPLHAAMCGASATLVHDLMMTPFDVVKQRMQLGYHRSVIDCARSIFKQEGLRAFYLSFPTTVAMNIPYGCVMVAVNESARKVILNFMTTGRDGSQYPTTASHRLKASLLSGCIAGGIAALVTTPLDVVKTRLQTQNLSFKSLSGPAPSGAPYLPGFSQARRHIVSSIPISPIASSTHHHKQNHETYCPKQSRIKTRPPLQPRYESLGQTLRSILAEEGPMGLLRGAVPRVFLHAPSVAVSWTAYELAKSMLASSKS